MTVKEMYQIVLDLVGLDAMPEDSGIIYDTGKEVTKVLAGIDMDVASLLLAKQLGYDCVAQHHPAGLQDAGWVELFGRDHTKKLMECGVPANHAQRLATKDKTKKLQGIHPLAQHKAAQSAFLGGGNKAFQALCHDAGKQLPLCGTQTDHAVAKLLKICKIGLKADDVYQRFALRGARVIRIGRVEDGVAFL